MFSYIESFYVYVNFRRIYIYINVAHFLSVSFSVH